MWNAKQAGTIAVGLEFAAFAIPRADGPFLLAGWASSRVGDRAFTATTSTRKQESNTGFLDPRKMERTAIGLVVVRFTWSPMFKRNTGVTFAIVSHHMTQREPSFRPIAAHRSSYV